MQSSSESLRWTAAGALAGLGAGLLLSAAWYAIEAATDETSEVVRLGRLSLRQGGVAAAKEAAPASIAEQTLSHGGHLVLSAAAGGLYARLTSREAARLSSGLGFGALFYAIAYGALAPLLGVRPPIWRDTRSKVLQRGFFHLLFGVLVATLTPLLARFLPSGRSTSNAFGAGTQRK